MLKYESLGARLEHRQCCNWVGRKESLYYQLKLFR